MPKVFIGMETSGQLRRRFQAQGHDVISCDLLHSDDGEYVSHIKGDVFEVLEWLRRNGWWPDLAIFHPDCTFLTSSAAWAFNDPDYDKYPGVGYHQKVKPGTLTGFHRRRARIAALDDVRRIEALPIARKAYENPARGAINTNIRKPSQIIQPYEFGDDASKATGLWLHNLPLLKIDPMARFDGRLVWRDGKFVEYWSNQTDTGQNCLGPGELRWQVRSKTYDGVADAIARQWGRLLWANELLAAA